VHGLHGDQVRRWGKESLSHGRDRSRERLGGGLGGGKEGHAGAGPEVLGSSKGKPGQDGPRSSVLIVRHAQEPVYTSRRWLRKLLVNEKVVMSYCERGVAHNSKIRNALHGTGVGKSWSE